MIRNPILIRSERGFTLIEIIIAIVLIGIAVPSIMIPFSGLSDTKTPEFTVQGSFIAQKRIERMADKNQANALADCNNGNEGAYTLNCVAATVNASDPDTAATSTFATKITLTVSRADGAMSPLTFTTLIVQ
jgi:prepilin-type N-terminal cleavage/methylation domain-containing protein